MVEEEEDDCEDIDSDLIKGIFQEDEDWSRPPDCEDDASRPRHFFLKLL